MKYGKIFTLVDALRDQFALPARVEGEQGRADVQENRRQRNVDQHGDPHRAFGLAFGRHRRVLLHVVLIGQQIAQVLRDPVDDHHPDRARRERERPTAQAELVGVESRLTSGWGRRMSRDNSPDDADNHHNRLHHIGPDDRFHAAQQRRRTLMTMIMNKTTEQTSATAR